MKMAGVAISISALIVILFFLLRAFPWYDTVSKDASWIFADIVHIPQFLLPFAFICFITKGSIAEYGFCLKQKPPIFTYRRMFGLGVVFGLFLSLKYIRQIAGNIPLDIPRPVTLANVVGNMTFQWIVVGLSEETMFRGLIQTYLMDNLSGYVKLFRHDFHVGTVIAAAIWGLFHFINILTMPLGPVLFFVLLTTVAGLFMGYAYQETRSLTITIIVHNTLFGIPLSIGYILHWFLE